MAQRKETKAQRLEREAAERAAREAEQAATYPQRLMALLERATALDFALDVKAGAFVLYNRDVRHPDIHTIDLEHSFAAELSLNDLEFAVGLKHMLEHVEAERKFQAEQAALAKLTKEERELLGL